MPDSSPVPQTGRELDASDIINLLIKTIKPNTNNISDGYHTFEQLYEHRIVLFIALALAISVSNDHSQRNAIWRSEKHSDDSVWEGWFLLGIGIKEGKQITYHLPMSYWKDCEFAHTLERAPDFDGHTSEDVLQRIKIL